MVFGSGCFWCSEAVFESLEGVTEVVSGYAGDTKENAIYEKVANHKTKHAEVIRITYDPGKITYGQLLRAFFTTHDPTTLDRAGPDVGHQYRSAIFFANAEEKRVAEAYIQQLTQAKAWADPIVTKLEPLTEFYAAEEYHQDYVKRNPNNGYVRQNVPKKLQKVIKELPDLAKKSAQ